MVARAARMSACLMAVSGSRDVPGATAAAHVKKRRFGEAERTQEPGAAAADGIARMARRQCGIESESTPDRVLSLNRPSGSRAALAPLRVFKSVSVD